ncbi:MAG: hypothetical protein JRJ84_19870 [Deltaproteobacteria bacterium]|nr:hypothetical protein [Deltaproteobacteria bacterium]
MDLLELPERNRRDEDAWVALWAASRDFEGMVEVIGSALDAQRPQLAARLVGLLPPGFEVDDEATIDTARRAARLLLLAQEESEKAWSELEEAWTQLRRSRMRRIKRRMRKSLMGNTDRTGRLDGGKGRR